MEVQFKEWPKILRWSNESYVITEKNVVLRLSEPLIGDFGHFIPPDASYDGTKMTPNFLPIGKESIEASTEPA